MLARLWTEVVMSFTDPRGITSPVPINMVKAEYGLDIVTYRNQCPFQEYNPSNCVSSMDLPSWIT